MDFVGLGKDRESASYAGPDGTPIPAFGVHRGAQRLLLLVSAIARFGLWFLVTRQCAHAGRHHGVNLNHRTGLVQSRRGRAADRAATPLTQCGTSGFDSRRDRLFIATLSNRCFRPRIGSGPSSLCQRRVHRSPRSAPRYHRWGQRRWRRCCRRSHPIRSDSYQPCWY
jgi:hypothetical protein